MRCTNVLLLVDLGTCTPGLYEDLSFELPRRAESVGLLIRVEGLQPIRKAPQERMSKVRRRNDSKCGPSRKQPPSAELNELGFIAKG